MQKYFSGQFPRVFKIDYNIPLNGPPAALRINLRSRCAAAAGSVGPHHAQIRARRAAPARPRCRHCYAAAPARLRCRHCYAAAEFPRRASPTCRAIHSYVFSSPPRVRSTAPTSVLSRSTCSGISMSKPSGSTSATRPTPIVSFSFALTRQGGGLPGIS